MLQDELDRAASEGAADPTDPNVAIVSKNLEVAVAAAESPRERSQQLRRPLLWWSGAAVETAWSALHEADQALLMLQGADTVKARLPEISAAVEANLPAGDSRIATYKELLKGYQEGNKLDRPQIRIIKRAVDAASDTAHSNVRGYRNILSAVGVILLIFAATLAIIHNADPKFISICQAQPGSSTSAPAPSTGGAAAASTSSGQATATKVTPCTGGADLAELELIGALGGLLAAVWALWRLDASSSPYGLPLYQALLRIPAGALAALFGILLLQSGALGVLIPQDADKLIAYGAVFGYAPDVLLRRVDARAKQLLGEARAKDDPQRTAPPPPGSGSPPGSPA
jgi:hypothetical protein